MFTVSILKLEVPWQLNIINANINLHQNGANNFIFFEIHTQTLPMAPTDEIH
jgi:hypothetical protein